MSSTHASPGIPIPGPCGLVRCSQSEHAGQVPNTDERELPSHHEFSNLENLRSTAAPLQTVLGISSRVPRVTLLLH